VGLANKIVEIENEIGRKCVGLGLQRDLFTQESFINGYASYFLDILKDKNKERRTSTPIAIADKDKVRNHKLTILYSSMSSYMRSTFFQVFPAAFPTFQLVIKPEEDSDLTADIVVVSVLDGGCGENWEQKCKNEFLHYRRKYQSAKLLLISGEAWDFSEAGDLGADALMGCHKNLNHLPKNVPYIHFPPAYSSWGERRLATWDDLLEGDEEGDEERKMGDKSVTTKYRMHSKKKFCAYMYSRCDRPERQLFFDILNERGLQRIGQGVDALGACGGAKVGETSIGRGDRYSHSFHDDAVDKYRDYTFVISFENVIEEGYVTEKIVNGMLAGSVPIYWGWEGLDLFNEKSYVHCNKLFGMGREGLEKCAEYVIDLYLDKDRLEEVMGESWKKGEGNGGKMKMRDEFDFGREGRVVRELREVFVKKK